MKKKYLILTITLLIVFILALSYGIYMSKDEIMIWIRGNNENKEEKIDYENIEVVSSRNNPIIPEGFKKIETEDASWELDENGNPKGWNNGLVIEDEIGNQFVWVPYIPNEKFEYFSAKTYNYYHLIIKYQGFYISRYEAGLPLELSSLKNEISADTNNIKGVPVSKAGCIPWNYINIYNAKYNAENMYEKNDNFITLLPNVRLREYTRYWLDEHFSLGRNSANFSNSRFNFSGFYSEDYGKNYKYGENINKNKVMILSTGASESTKVKNVYDFWGNLAEGAINSISEYDYIYANVSRSNYTNKYSYDEEAFYNPRSVIGFRIILHLK